MAMPNQGRAGSPKTQPVKKSGVSSKKEAPKSTLVGGTKPAGTRGSNKGAR